MLYFIFYIFFQNNGGNVPKSPPFQASLWESLTAISRWLATTPRFGWESRTRFWPAPKIRNITKKEVIKQDISSFFFPHTASLHKRHCSSRFCIFLCSVQVFGIETPLRATSRFSPDSKVPEWARTTSWRLQMRQERPFGAFQWSMSL